MLRSSILFGIEFNKGVNSFSSPSTIAVLLRALGFLISPMISPMYFACPIFFAVPITEIFFCVE